MSGHEDTPGRPCLFGVGAMLLVGAGFIAQFVLAGAFLVHSYL
jgi:hypothetical protein